MSGKPIPHHELEILFALCESAGNIKNETQATVLLDRLSNYLAESCTQSFLSSRTFQLLRPTPWTFLTFNLTSAICKLAVNFPSLYPRAEDSFVYYLDSLNNGERNITKYFSIAGFLNGFIKNTKFLNLKFINIINEHLTKEYIVDLESVLANLSEPLYNDLVSSFEETGFEFSSVYLLCSLQILYREYLKSLLSIDATTSISKYILLIKEKNSSEKLLLSESVSESLPSIAEFSLSTINFVQTNPERFVSATMSRKNNGFSIIANSLDCLLLCMETSTIDEEKLKEIVFSYLDEVEKYIDSHSKDVIEIANSDILPFLFYTCAYLSINDNAVGYRLHRVCPIVLSLPLINIDAVKEMAYSIAFSLQYLSQDEIVSTIYVLTNVLLEDSDEKPNHDVRNNKTRSSTLNSEVDSNILDEVSEVSIEIQPIVFRNIIETVLEIARQLNDESVNILVTTILSQKIKKQSYDLNILILHGLCGFINFMAKREFLVTVRSFFELSLHSLKHNDEAAIASINECWVCFSQSVRSCGDNDTYELYLHEILSTIVALGDMDDISSHRSNTDVHLAATKIALLLKPLAYLFPDINEESNIPKSREIISLFKDAWSNLAVHGFAYKSLLTQKYLTCLRRIAHSSPALASESSWNRTETSIEMNTILRRGTSKGTEKLHKDILSPIMNVNLLDGPVSRPKLFFLSATLLLENLRMSCGNCSTILDYFSDPSIAITGIQSFINDISIFNIKEYTNLIKSGGKHQFTVEEVSNQLRQIFIFTCHRDIDLQRTALTCSDYLISRVPSSLCHSESLFPLLDILSLLFESVIDADTHEYEPSTRFISSNCQVELFLSDSYKWRHDTLDQLSVAARKWVTLSLTKCNKDMKSLLQAYISKFKGTPSKGIDYGVSFALEMAGKVLPVDRELFALERSAYNRTDTIAGFLTQFSWKSNFKHEVYSKISGYTVTDGHAVVLKIRNTLKSLETRLENKEDVSAEEFNSALQDASAAVILGSIPAGDILAAIVRIPFIRFDVTDIEVGIDIWLTIIKEKPMLASSIISQILYRFEESIKQNKGLYDCSYDIENSKFNLMSYLPSSKESIDYQGNQAARLFKPHLLLIRFFSSHFEVAKYQSDHIFKLFTRATLISLSSLPNASYHPFSRLIRFELVKFALDLLSVHILLNSRDISALVTAIYDGSLSWFTKKAITPYGSNKLKIKADFGVLNSVARQVKEMRLPDVDMKRDILLLFLEQELSFLSTWLNPLNPSDISGQYSSSKADEKLIVSAFNIDGKLAINLVSRYNLQKYDKLLYKLIIDSPVKVLNEPDAVNFVLEYNNVGSGFDMKYLTLWDSVAPLDAINFFLPPHNKNPFVLQLTMRSIESYDIFLTFFYVPQIVQALRYDNELAYVRRYILETANVSQLFAHQIIWNMSANMYKDEDSTIPDGIKPVLDNVRDTMVSEFSIEDKKFYEKEFSFFSEVTGISGKLKPYIKKSKQEMKVKIDEEMAIIKVEEGVYLPSNPDGTVTDINRKSGRPLQSHAKAPFMASFQIKKEVPRVVDDHVINEEVNSTLAAIFKVGDDCRQDVLALQLISIFRTIWMDAGLDVYVFPYRVTATAPGCGIIDVLPNSISRDMLGREAVNGLYEYFITQFGPETSPEFQHARNNFIKSLASYSVITYLLQIKDRHNGNIMYDNQGHILHIDFGFCFDIVPGGVKFEQSPFKLTREMVRVMGGSSDTQAYIWFEELCVKSFLSCRKYMDVIIKCIVPMLDSGLPCFKPATIKNLTARFVPNKTDKEAAIYMRSLIKKSFESFATKGYDEFQRLTNGIPY